MATYTVRVGDTMARIASRLGSSVPELLDLNQHVVEPDLIFPGQVLAVPDAEPAGESDSGDVARLDGYVVRAGDTLAGIASSRGTTVDRILDLNPLVSDPALIVPGQILTLPSASVSTVPAADDPVTGDPAWLVAALREMDTGVDEQTGSSHNPRIVEYHQTTTLRATDDETPWCSSFVNWCIQQAGVVGTRSAAARSWLNWGAALDRARRGCVVIFRRGSNPRSGHVAFLWETRGDRVLVLGGNQDNQVSIKSYPGADLLGLRWPSDA